MISTVPINPETEIVGSSWDPVSRTYSYTVGRHGHRWTVPVAEKELHDIGSGLVNKANRLNYIRTKLHNAMQTQEPDK